jgi:hypothetical protein
MNPQEIDAHLDDVTIKQLTFKPGVATDVAVAIVKHYVEHLVAFADEVNLPALADADVNCVGLAWRRLANVGIICQTGDHRRSQRDRRKGGVVWKYRLLSHKLAVTFLARNGITNFRRGQGELPLN